MRLRFWTAIVGYDPRDRSFRNYIYLLYVVVFFSIWGFAVLSLLADTGSAVLRLVSGFSPPVAAIMLIGGLLLIVAVIQGYRAGVHSPFHFSDTDAELICQTPVNRSQVAIAWFLGDWIAGALLYCALAVVMRFASLQMVIPGGFTWSLLPRFLLIGVQTTAIVLPLNMVVSSLVYVIGALRLVGGLENRWIRWVPVGIGVILVAAMLGGMPFAQIILWPALFPFSAAFGITHWLPGFAVILLLAGLSLLALYASGRGLNLSRAGQESRARRGLRQGAWMGDTPRSQKKKSRQALGFGHALSRIPGKEGIFSLLWKDGVAITRGPRLIKIITWLGIFGVNLAMLLAPDWGTRLWSFIIWVLLVALRGTHGFRSGLSVWVVTRQLPFSAREVVIANHSLTSVTAILINWISYGVCAFLGHPPPVFVLLLLPGAVLCLIQAAEFDILRHSQESELLVGQVAELGAGGLLIGVVLAGLPIILVSGLMSLHLVPGLAVLIILLGFFLSASAVYATWSLAALAYTNIS